MKPGTIVKIIDKTATWESDQVTVFIGSMDPENFKWPSHKKIKRGSVGFLVRKHPKPLFDWIVEVSLPDASALGWIDKSLLEELSPSKFEDQLRGS